MQDVEKDPDAGEKKVRSKIRSTDPREQRAGKWL
jgi:hypothetical protein